MTLKLYFRKNKNKNSDSQKMKGSQIFGMWDQDIDF